MPNAGKVKYNVVLHPTTNGVEDRSIDLLPETRPQTADDITTVGVAAGKVLTADGQGRAAFEAVKAYLDFPESWSHYTTPLSTTAGFCNHVTNDTTATANMVFLGELRCSDLPAGVGNAEAVVEIIYDNTLHTKVIHIVMSSGNVAPYHWEYTYWDGQSPQGWIGFQPEITDLGTIRSNAIAGRAAKDFIDQIESVTNQEIEDMFSESVDEMLGE